MAIMRVQNLRPNDPQMPVGHLSFKDPYGNVLFLSIKVSLARLGNLEAHLLMVGCGIKLWNHKHRLVYGLQFEFHA